MQVYAGRGASSERCHLIMTNMSRHVHTHNFFLPIHFPFSSGHRSCIGRQFALEIENVCMLLMFVLSRNIN